MDKVTKEYLDLKFEQIDEKFDKIENSMEKHDNYTATLGRIVYGLIGGVALLGYLLAANLLSFQ